MDDSFTTRYESLFENSLVPMLLIDLETSAIIEANPAASDFYGYERSEMAGMSIAEIETMEEAEIGAHMDRQRQELKEVGRILKHRRADGSIRAVDVRVGMMPDLPGHTAYAIIVDVTAREAAFHELDEHRLRLEELLEARTRQLDEARSKLGENGA
jgi:PAS domain S-box-containing protein